MAQKNASDEIAVGKQQEKRKDAEHYESRNVSEVMGTKAGRAVIRMVLRACSFSTPSFNPGMSETFESVTFREGKKSVGNRIIEVIHEACPEMYALMMSEGKPKVDEEETKNDEKLDT